MKTINLICVGRLKEDYLRAACAEYEKRLKATVKLNITEITPVPLPEKPSEKQVFAALEAEGRQIIQKIPPGSFVVAMCVEGRQLSSEELSGRLSDAEINGKKPCFIIGGSFGMSPDVKALADLRLSVSKMTFPHQLFRVMLLEQIYRSEQIQLHTKYHK